MFDFVSASDESYALVVCKSNKELWYNQARKKKRDCNTEKNGFFIEGIVQYWRNSE